jgi:TonB family protein
LRSDELLGAFEIDPAPIWPVDDDRLEPIFLAGPFGIAFEDRPDAAPTHGMDETPLFVEFEEFLHLDPGRSEEEPTKPPPAPRRRAATVSFFGSLGLHLLVLLGLFGGNSAPAEVTGAIPVQLVIEKPSEAADESQPTRSVSQSASETAPADSTKATAAATPPKRAPPPPVAAAMPPPKPHPPPPAPKPVAAAAPPQSAPPAPAAPAATPAKVAPNRAPREAAAPGPDASRGDYLNYLVTLTRGHFDLLPLSFLAGRRGRTILSVLVFEDGTISRVSIRRGSGYPDIDARIEQMVTAVGRFPPVPNSFRKPSVELDFNMAFPDALQQ